MRISLSAMALLILAPSGCGGSATNPPISPRSIEGGIVVSCQWVADFVIVPFLPGGGGPTGCEVAVAANESAPVSADEASGTWFVARQAMDMATMEIEGYGELELGDGIWTTCTSPDRFGNQCATFEINQSTPVVTVHQVSSGAGVYAEFISNTTGDRLETHDIFIKNEDVDQCARQVQRERECSGGELSDGDIRACVRAAEYDCEAPELPQMQADYWTCRASGECAEGAWLVPDDCSGTVPECPAN